MFDFPTGGCRRGRVGVVSGAGGGAKERVSVKTSRRRGTVTCQDMDMPENREIPAKWQLDSGVRVKPQQEVGLGTKLGQSCQVVSQFPHHLPCPGSHQGL